MLRIWLYTYMTSLLFYHFRWYWYVMHFGFAIPVIWKVTYDIEFSLCYVGDYLRIWMLHRFITFGDTVTYCISVLWYMICDLMWIVYARSLLLFMILFRIAFRFYNMYIWKITYDVDFNFYVCDCDIHVILLWYCYVMHPFLVVRGPRMIMTL